MVRSSTESQDQGEEHDADNGDDLERGEPEFEFTKERNTEVVDDQDGDEEDGDEDSGIDFFAIDPELNDESSSRQLVGGDDDVLDPVAKKVKCQ